MTDIIYTWIHYALKIPTWSCMSPTAKDGSGEGEGDRGRLGCLENSRDCWELDWQLNFKSGFSEGEECS